jgi:8-oxo-dGTP pyrophosphatase MutT (NUDIX family)
MTGAAPGAALRRRVQRVGLLAYRLLPTPWRRVAVRTVCPTYTAGSLVEIEDASGSVLLIRHTYRKDWGLPGGLLDRGERPDAAAVREVREEVGLDVELAGAPRVVMDPLERRIDFVYRARLRGAGSVAAAPCSPELAEAAWFRRDAFPPLHENAATALAALADGGAVPYVPPPRARRRGLRRRRRSPAGDQR